MTRIYTPLMLGLLLWSSTPAEAQSPPTPDIIHIPLIASNDNQRYIANVNMSLGPQSQRFGFALSTTTGYTVVADTSCTSCASSNIPTYNASQSVTAKPLDSTQQQQVPIAGGTINAGAGFRSKEDCALHQANGSFWQYPNQTIVQVNASSVLQAGISGLIGLGTNTADFGDTVFGPWLGRNPAQHNFTFGLALNPLPGTQAQVPAITGDPNDSSASAGTLHMQQPDPLSYTGDVQWQPVQNPSGASSGTGLNIGDLGNSSWLIHMDGWNFTAGGARSSNSNGGLAAVEPFFANLFLPQAEAKQVYATVSGSQAASTASSDLGQAYSIPCDADITFSVILSGQEYLIPKEALVIQGSDGSCTGAIEGWLDSSVTDYLLGSRFISTVYMVFQVGRTPGTQQVGLARRTKGAQTKGKPSVGPIVGGVVGGVAFVLLVGGALFWWVRRRARRTAKPAVAVGRKEGSEKMHIKADPDGYTVDHWAPSSLSHTRDGTAFSHSNLSYTGTTPEPYHSNVGTPSSANFSPPNTATSETFLATPPPKVNQWVTGMHPNAPPRPNVPTEYDYGNRGEPGQLAPPAALDTVDGHESYASSTLAAPSQSWLPDRLKDRDT